MAQQELTPIEELKQLNAAYLASLEFDYCPDATKAETILKLFDIGVSEDELVDALNAHQGSRPDELARRISNLIKTL